MYKIIGADGKEYGPISAEVLRQWLAEGRADAQTKILAEGTTEWKPLSAFPELATVPPTHPPPLPPGPSAGLSAGPLAGPGAKNQVGGPAVALMITAILGILCQIVGIVWQIVGMPLMLAQQNQQMPAAFTMMTGKLSVVLGGFNILVGVFIFFAALKMKKLENYTLALTGTVLAMIPCLSPCCLLGLPFGIWALVVLNKPEVKESFH